MNISDWKDTARMYQQENKRLAVQVAELQAKLEGKQEGKQEPVAYLWPAVGNHPASIHWPAEVAHDAAIRNVAEPLYRLPPNTEAMVESAIEEEREACAKLCEEVITYPAGHSGNFEGYGPVNTTRSGKQCAAAIRARK